MILRELDLDVPSIDNDRGYEFCNEVRSIAAHYYSYLPKKFETDGFWKLLVECVDSEGDSELYLNVKVVKIKFDYEHYQTLDNQKKEDFEYKKRRLESISGTKDFDLLTHRKKNKSSLDIKWDLIFIAVIFFGTLLFFENVNSYTDSIIKFKMAKGLGAYLVPLRLRQQPLNL